MTATSVPIEGLASATPMRHALLIDRHDEDGRIYYTAACRCCRWSDRSAFRALIVKAYQHHLRDAKHDPNGRHDAIRAQLRALRGLLAPSTDGDPLVAA